MKKNPELEKAGSKVALPWKRYQEGSQFGRKFSLVRILVFFSYFTGKDAECEKILFCPDHFLTK